jgi:hypothetical protein
MLLLIATGLTAIGMAAVFSRRLRTADATRVADNRDLLVPKSGDRGLLSCFEIPGIPSMRDERASL